MDRFALLSFATLVALSSCTRSENTSDGGAAAMPRLAAQPANSWLAVDWSKDAGAEMRRSWGRGASAESGLQAFLALPDATCSLIAPKQRGTTPRVVARVVVPAASSAATESILEQLAPARWKRIRLRGGARAVEPAQWPEGYAPSERRLGSVSWFADGVQELTAVLDGEDRPRLVAGACNLTETLRLFARLEGGGRSGALVSRIPGMNGFRSLLFDVRARPGSQAPRIQDAEIARAIVGFSRSKVGFAKALALESAPLRFEPALRALAARGVEASGDRSKKARLAFLDVRLEVSVLVDSVGAVFGALTLGPLGPNPGAMLRSLRIGRVLTRKFWRSFGKEFAFVMADGSARDFCALAIVRDREAAAGELREVFGDPRRVEGGIERFERRIGPATLIVRLDEHVVALSTTSFEESARALARGVTDGTSGQPRSIAARASAGSFGLERGIELLARRVEAGLYVEARYDGR